MMRQSNLIIALIACLAWHGRAGAQVAVSSWNLTTGVQDLSASGGGQDAAFFETVQNPFVNSHSATLGGGTATTSYDISWFGDNASFRIGAAHVDPDLGGVRYVCESSGSIRFSLTNTVRARITGTFQYNLPAPGTDLFYGLTIFDLQTLHVVLSDSRQADTFTSPSQSGTFSLDQSAILPAGHSFFVQYVVRTDASGNSGLLATGDGYLHLTLEPVPEPATLMLSSVAIALCIRRSRCRTTKTMHVRTSSAGRHSARAYD